MTRLQFLRSVAAVALIALVPMSLHAQEADGAAFVSTFAQKGINDILTAGIANAEKQQRFRDMLKTYFDIPGIGRFVLARFAKAASPAELEKFNTLFEDVIVYTLSRRFSEYNGQTLKVTGQQPDGKGKREMVRNIASELAATDPKAAFELALTLSPGTPQDQALASIASRWATADLDAALAWVKQLPAGRAKENALINLSHEWAQASPRAAADFAATLAPGNTQNSLFAAVANQWATADPAAAMQWAQSLPNEVARQLALDASLTVWANDEPEQAAAFVARLPASSNKGELIHNLASSWGETDPEATLKWARQLPASEQQLAFNGLVQTMADDNPAGAAALLENTTPENRAAVGELIAYQWLLLDPAAARDWIAKAPLSPEQKLKLLKQ